MENKGLNIGGNVFCVDLKEKKIFEGILLGINISQENGYVLLKVVSKDLSSESIMEIEKVYATKEEAEKYLQRVEPLLEKINKDVKTYEEEINKQRVEIIGKPDFDSLVKRIKDKRGVKNG